MTNTRLLSMAMALVGASLPLISGVVGAQTVDPSVKTLAAPADPAKNAVLIGRLATGGMIFQLELEGSEPMWGSSGLHYSANSALLGDGSYAATVTVGVPTFQRELEHNDLWSKPVSAKFHFKLKNGMLADVSKPKV